MEQASGGNFFEDVKNVLKKIFQDPGKPIISEPVIARGKC